MGLHGMLPAGVEVKVLSQGLTRQLICVRARRQHPWFTLHLPRYLAVMQADTLASSAMIDDEVVAEVVKLGFRRAEVVDSIQKRVQNKARAQRTPHRVSLTQQPGTLSAASAGGNAAA